jgi:hypothetical protein
MYPLLFVSVASKVFSDPVSLLFATLMVESISVAGKGLTQTDYWRESNWVGWEDLEGVRRTAWRASPGTETGMPRNCIRDAKGAQKTHMAVKAPKKRADLNNPLYHIGTVCQALLVSGLDTVG